MPTREQYLAEAQKRGLLSPQEREQRYGVLRAPPGFLERHLPAAGQITGGIAGTPGGFPGTVAGATAGALVGRGAQQLIRKRYGERFTPEKVAGELGGEAAITGAVETALPLVGRAVRPVVKPVLDKFAKKVLRPGVENVLRFMTSITPESTERLLTRGPKNILIRPLRAREKGIRIAENFLSQAKEAQKAVNAQWRQTFNPLMEDLTQGIPTQPLKQVIEQVEQDFAGSISPILPSTKDVFKPVQGVLEDLRLLTAGTQLPVKSAVLARQQLDDVIFSGRQQGLFTPRQVSALKTVRNSLSEGIHQTFPQTRLVDEQQFILRKTLKIIERFSPESVSSVDRLGKMIDTFEDISPAAREALMKADTVIQENTGQSLIGLIRDRAAARAFEPTELRAVRTWLIGAVLGGLGLTTGGPLAGSAGTALGITLSSPRLAGEALRGLFTVGRGIKTATRKTAPVASAELLRQKFLSPSPQENNRELSR